MTSVVEQALACWGWERAPCTFVAGRENQVYRVSAPEGVFALRIKRPGYRSQSELLSELQWMDAMGSAGVSVPRPRQSLSGRWLESVQGQLVDVIGWLDGQPLGQTGVPLQLNDAPQVFQRLGVAMAQFHQACDRWAPPASFTRCHWDAEGLLGDEPLWGRFWDNPGLDAPTRDLLITFRQRASAVLAQWPNLDCGLIHADWVRENVLLNGDQVQLIDFDDGGFGFRLFDVATALIKNRKEADFPSLRETLIDGYRTVRALDTDQLDLFMALRAVTYVGWIVPRLHEPGAPERQTRCVRDAKELCAAWLERQ